MTTTKPRGQRAKLLHVILLLSAYYACWVSGGRPRGIRGQKLHQEKRQLLLIATNPAAAKVVIEWDQGEDHTGSKSRQDRKLQQDDFNSRTGGELAGTGEQDPFLPDDRMFNLAENFSAALEELYPVDADGVVVIGGNLTGASNHSSLYPTASPSMPTVLVSEDMVLSAREDMNGQGLESNPPAPATGQAMGVQEASGAPKATAGGEGAKGTSGAPKATAGREGTSDKGQDAKATAGDRKATGATQGASGPAEKKSTSGAYGTSQQATSGGGGGKGGAQSMSKKVKGASATAATSSGSNSKKSMSGVMGVSGGGKGGKGGSKSGGVSSTSGVVSSAQGNPGETLSSSEVDPYPGIDAATSDRGGLGVEVDCDAIAAGGADIPAAPNAATFRAFADMILEEGAVFLTVSQEVKTYLQTQVAPSIAGCESARQRRQRQRQRRRRTLELKRRSLQFMSPESLITNVVFGDIFSDGSCSEDLPNNCHKTLTEVDIQYYGTGTGIGLRVLAYLQAAGQFAVPGLLAIGNLRVYDSDGHPVAGDTIPTETVSTGNNSDKPTDSGGGAVSSAQSDAASNADTDGLTTWSKALIGLSVVAAFLCMIVCYLLYRRNQRVGDHDAPYFESLPSDRSVTRDLGEAPPEKSFTKDISKRLRFEKTWNGENVDEDDEDNDQTANTTRIGIDSGGDTHICTSSYCEACSHHRSRIQFVPAIQPEDFNELPPDATRSYRTADTVNL